MAGLQYSSYFKRGGVNLPSRDEVHILRAPPSSIHTRKKERISDSDVQYMVRNDDSRINEGVQYIARGTNPHIDVMYTNSQGAGGSTTTSLTNIASTNPYKAFRDGAFRPPLFFQEDLQPLSRLRHPESAVSTNPAVRSGFSVPNLVETIDKAPIKANIFKASNTNYIPMASKASYKIQMPTEVFTQYAVKDELKTITAGTNLMIGDHKGGDVHDRNNVVTALKDALRIENVTPNFSIMVYNPATNNYSEIEGSIKDKQNIAVQSGLSQAISLEREDGTPIKIRDYQAKVVKSAVSGMTQLVLTLTNEDDIHLDRNLPLHAIGSGYVSYKKDVFSDMQPIMADRVKTSANGTLKISTGIEDTSRVYNYDVGLTRQGNYGSFENQGTVARERYDYAPMQHRDTSRVKSAASQFGDRFGQSS
jgi:hypothetical protein